MNCIIDVGGGNKGAFADGVFDYLMDNDIRMDMCIGVSAGAANCCSYIAGQRGRNLQFYTNYSLSPKAVGFLAWIKTGGSFIDLDYIYQKVSNSDGTCPLDFESYSKSDMKAFFVATDVQTGAPVYFDKDELRKDSYGAICASSAMPVACKPYKYNGRLYYDGYLSDPIPVEKAISEGADKIIVLLVLPKDHFRSGKEDAEIAAKLKKYPAAAKLAAEYAKTYNRQLELALKLEKEDRALIIAPKGFNKMKAMGKEKEQILKMYNEGYDMAESVKGFLV